MKGTTKIPLVKQQIITGKRKKRSRLFIFTVFVTALALLLFHVWIRVQTNNLLTEIRQLQEENQKITQINDELKAKVTELANYGRIHKIAENQLGLVFVPDEKKIEIE